MPIVRIEMLGGRSSRQKQELVSAITKEVCRIIQSAPGDIIVLIDEKRRDDWSVGGKSVAQLEDE